MTLRDGRTLALAECGDPQGYPLLFLHGLPGCRLLHPDGGLSRSLAIRLLTVDRPGFGRSEPRPGRSLLDWAGDVGQLADDLGLERFLVVGSSGGGPFALACAHALGDRVSGVAVLGGSGPVETPGAMDGIATERRVGYWLARHSAPLLRLAMRFRGDPRKDPEAFFASYTSHNPASDQEILARPAVRAMFLENFAEATRQGIDAFAWEVQLVSREWGFPLEEIQVPTHFWHGEEDNSTPVGMARAMAAAIPGATLRVQPGVGHLIAFACWEDVVAELMATLVPSPAPRTCAAP